MSSPPDAVARVPRADGADVPSGLGGRLPAVPVLLLLAIGSPAGAQQPAPVFRTGVDLVAVDVSVIDREGQPVSGLTADDFTLKVDGRPRQIVSVEYISQIAAGAGRPGAERPRHFSSNEESEVGRLIMLAVDESSIPIGSARVVMDAAGRFIDGLTPADRLALAVFPGTGPNIAFTSNHASVRDALRRVTGKPDTLYTQFNIGQAEALAIERRDDVMLATVLARECQNQGPQCAEYVEQDARLLAQHLLIKARTSLGALRAVLNGLRGIEGTKTLVLMSAGLTTEYTQTEASAIGQAALAAQVNIYVLQIDVPRFDASQGRLSPTASEDERLRELGLETLAGSARGGWFKVVGAGDFAFTRIARELSAYYLLAFEPEPGDRDGRAHRIQIDIARRGVTLRARREFVAESPAAAERTPAERIAELLRAPLLATKLPIRVTTFTFRDRESSRLRVVVSAEADTGGAPSDGLIMGFVLTDAKGDPVTGASGEMPDGRYTASVVVEPGRYTLKLGAIDGEGRRGSVEHRVDATLVDTSGIQLGDLMLTEQPDERGLPPRPAVDRATSDRLLAYLEIYGADPRVLETARVMVDVAQDESSGALLGGAADLGEPGGRRRVAQGALDVGLLPPGEYVARADVSIAGRSVARLARPFRVVREAVALNEGEERPEASPAVPSARIVPDLPRFRLEEALEPRIVGFFLDELLKLQSAPPSARLQGAIEQARGGRFDELARELSVPESERAAATFMRGLGLYARGDLQSAATHFRAAVRMASAFYPAIVYLGACYAARGLDGEAVAAWQTSLSVETELLPTFEFLADALFRLNDGEQALGILDEAAELWPQEDGFTRRRATAYAMLGRHREAYGILARYLDRHDDDPDTLFLAMRLIYEAHVAGLSHSTPQEDLARLKQYAERYASRSGPRQQIVTQWVRFLEQRGQ